MVEIKRIQMKGYRDNSWKENPNAVYVGRPTKWGNPFKVEDYGLEECLKRYERWIKAKIKRDPNYVEPLRGKDLVCYCSLDKKCHADILIILANKTNEILKSDNYTCPVCGYDNTSCNEDDVEIEDFRSGSNPIQGNWTDWIALVICQKCKNTFKVEDGC